MTLIFPGTPYTGTGEVTLNKVEGVDWSGWNLVGNPFNKTAYIADSRLFYTMNTDVRSLGYLHLIDLETGDDVDLLKEPFYKFDSRTIDKPWRFELVFKTESCIFQEEPAKVKTRGDFAYQADSDIVVTGDGTLEIYDVMGRLVSVQRVSGVEKMSALTQGVYILRLIGDEIETQKIVVR